jgi:GT2 family glycosyltransferase
MNERPLSIVVVHWNRPDECLATVGHFQQQGLPVSLCVVDNGSRPECVAALKAALPPGVELVQLSENKGWGGALNVMLRRWLAEQEGDLCVISAHDAIPRPDCLRLLIAAMECDGNLGIACPQYGKPEVAQFSPVRGITFTATEPRGTGEVTAVEIPHGTLQIFRRQCLKQIGLLDERYFAYGDEAEIGLRARKMSWGVGMVWGAIVINPGTWTSSPVVGYLSARGSLLMARTHGGLGSALLRALLMAANTLRLCCSPSVWNTMSSPRARFLAIRDYFLGRYGPPPRSLIPGPVNSSPGPVQ